MVNKADVAAEVAERLNGTDPDARQYVDAVFDVIMGHVAAGERVQILGFGTFDRVERAARVGRNPRTGAAIQVPASAAPRFHAGQTFRTQVSGASAGSAATAASAAPVAEAAQQEPAKPAKAKKVSAKKVSAKKTKAADRKPANVAAEKPIEAAAAAAAKKPAQTEKKKAAKAADEKAAKLTPKTVTKSLKGAKKSTKAKKR